VVCDLKSDYELFRELRQIYGGALLDPPLETLSDDEGLLSTKQDSSLQLGRLGGRCRSIGGSNRLSNLAFTGEPKLVGGILQSRRRNVQTIRVQSQQPGEERQQHIGKFEFKETDQKIINRAMLAAAAFAATFGSVYVHIAGYNYMRRGRRKIALLCSISGKALAFGGPFGLLLLWFFV
jgi:hypothetical protein